MIRVSVFSSLTVVGLGTEMGICQHEKPYRIRGGHGICVGIPVLLLALHHRCDFNITVVLWYPI